MSLNFGDNNINHFKAQSAYKDASGMGGGGMYFQQRKKQKKEEDDIFEHQPTEEDQNDNEITFSEMKEENIPQDTVFNKFVNWFRQKNKN